jgi:hypothetical protein
MHFVISSRSHIGAAAMLRRCGCGLLAGSKSNFAPCTPTPRCWGGRLHLSGSRISSCIVYRIGAVSIAPDRAGTLIGPESGSK